MPNKLLEQLEAVMPAGMQVPQAMKQLYDWIENRNLFVDNGDGHIGFLYPENLLKASWTDEGRDGGTEIEFAAEGSVNLHYWFGAEYEEVNQRLCVFAQTGGEGSMGAFWLSDTGEVKIVHLGSGSGSTLTCVLAENCVDFLRLLAIGYNELCWSDEFNSPPLANDEFVVQPNVEFQQWVRNTFSVTIPETALEIVKYPALMDDEVSEDEFWNWCQKFKQEETKEDRLAIAASMKAVGIETEQIVEMTGLSALEVGALE
jgi:hypothetical protein